MRPELSEYKYDWLLWAAMRQAPNILRSTKKELEAALSLMPDRKAMMESQLRMGEVAIKLAEGMSWYLEKIVNAHENNEKVCLTTFCYPVGILNAFGCAALNMEMMSVTGTNLWRRGCFDFLDYCSEVGMTETSCSGQRAGMGAYLAKAGTLPDFCVVNTAGICDTNANAFHFYSSYTDIPMYMHDSPPQLTGERAAKYHRKDFRKMLEFLEKHTGKKLDWDYLRDVAQEIKKQDELINEMQILMSHVPSPFTPMVAYMPTAVRFLFNGLKIGTEILEAGVRLGKENISKGIAGTVSGKEKARILGAYIFHATRDLRYWEFFEKNDLTYMGDMLSWFWNKGAPYSAGRENETYEIDLTSEDSIIDTLADQLARMPMIKQIRGPYDAPEMWLQDNLSAAKVYKADAAIYIGTLGCRNTWGMVKPFARDMEKAGIPTYILFADAFDDRITSWDVCESKMEEFLRVRKIL